jgi:hypothetical protein
MTTNFDNSRSKIISNQIDYMKITEQFIANGIATQFTLSSECFYSSGFDPNGGADIEVFENGLKLERYGGSADYIMQYDINTQLKIINFLIAPLSNHIITAEYRPLINK